MRIWIAILVLILVSLACEKVTPTPAVTPEAVVISTFTPTPEPTRTPAPTPTEPSRIIMVTALTLNCRFEPSQSSPVVAVLPQNATYEANVYADVWVQITPAVGASPCWIYKDWVKVE